MTTTDIKYHPVLFADEMVRAILDNRKTQTRRPIRPQPPQHWSIPPARLYEGYLNQYGCQQSASSIRCPYAVGDRLWVRECFGVFDSDGSDTPDSFAIGYRADGDDAPAVWLKPTGKIYTHEYANQKYRAKTHMPRWASRIMLEVTDVRVERVKEISEEDAIAEGIELIRGRYTFNGGLHESRTAKGSFEVLWRSIYGDDSWFEDWVWSISFKKVEAGNG